MFTTAEASVRGSLMISGESVSRKSAAYHRAYKQCEGSEEEKKAAARKVH